MFYNFIVSKKAKKNILAILFISALVLLGISIGVICISITQFNYVENLEENNLIEDVYYTEMKDNLIVDDIGDSNSIKYIETDLNDVKIIVKHPKYFITNVFNKNDTIEVYCYQNSFDFMEYIKDIVEDLNNKVIKNYSSYEIYVYTSKKNIETIKKNNF